jgi:hypothetical protein
MRKLFLTLPLLIFCTAIGTIAQTSTDSEKASAKKVIRWGSPSLPAGCCNNFFDNNRLKTTYQDENVIFEIGLDTTVEKKFFAVLISIGNKTDQPLTILPDTFTMRLMAPKNKTLSPVPVDEVAQKIENRGRWRLLAAGMLAGMATQQSRATITDNRGNRADITVTERDRAAQRNASEAAGQQRSENEERASVIKAVALPKHTLFKDDVKGGVVFFKKEDLTDGVIISFTLGDTTYEIPYGTERVPAKSGAAK